MNVLCSYHALIENQFVNQLSPGKSAKFKKITMFKLEGHYFKLHFGTSAFQITCDCRRSSVFFFFYPNIGGATMVADSAT